jgi:hypothetical protein
MASDWVMVGDNILNVDSIEFIERVWKDVDNNTPHTILLHMSSGKIIELTHNTGLELWKYLDRERLKFFDLENPERDFSGT